LTAVWDSWTQVHNYNPIQRYQSCFCTPTSSSRIVRRISHVMNKQTVKQTNIQNKSSAVAEMGDRGHNRHGQKIGGCLTNFPVVDTWLSCEDVVRQSCAMVCMQMAIFLRIFCVLHFQRAACSTIDRYSKCALRPNYVWKYGRHPIYAGLRIGEEKRRIRMWANAQRDGRPAEYRWHPLFNAAKFGWGPLLECCARCQDAKAVQISWGAPNHRTDLSR